MRIRPLLLTLLAMGACLSSGNMCHAGFTFLGPTPYLSAADSPFAKHLGKPNFYLEDFEDGELNTPGIQDSYAQWNHVVGPSATTASVDSDDGLIDGNGTNGHALMTSQYIRYPMLPEVFERWFHFSLEDRAYVGGVTAFGFVWTDGPIGSTLLMRAFDTTGILIGEMRFHELGDETTAGTTANHRFFGIVSSIPFSAVEITSISLGTLPPPLQIDHVQYGWLAVPEPSGFALCGLGLLIGVVLRRRQAALLVLIAMGACCLGSDHARAGYLPGHYVLPPNWGEPPIIPCGNNCGPCIGICGEGFISLGPAPYLSAADSPFASYLGQSNFFLEDFEDGELNTPGIYQPLIPATHGVIQGGIGANTVDPDGHSLRSNFYAYRPTDPPISTSFLRFAFDQSYLEKLPNAFGFVLTGAPAGTLLQIEVFDLGHNSLGTVGFTNLGGGSLNDVTDDRFLGLISEESFFSVEIRAVYVGDPTFVEIDHVQYGAVVPEPAATRLLASLLVGISIFFRRSLELSKFFHQRDI